MEFHQSSKVQQVSKISLVQGDTSETLTWNPSCYRALFI